MPDQIPCLDLKRQHASIKNEVFEAFEKVYDQTAFSGGGFAEDFEKQFSEYCNIPFAIALNNGTSALHLALIAAGINEGDEVIIPANTFIATAWAVSYCGAVPVFVDCTKDTWQIDAVKIREKISSKTKAIIGVHLYGQAFDFDAVKQIADENKLILIEDAAQAQGAHYKNNKCGSLAEIACFSFYPGKNLGACGEAGAVTTKSESIAAHIKSLRNHGSKKRYYHEELGFNMRMGGLEAASLQVKLKYIDSWNDARRMIAKRYFTEMKNPKITFQFQQDWSDSNFHLFVITVENRKLFMEHLNAENIFPGLHYPVPCHLQEAYKHLNYKKGDCPNAEYLSEHCVSLPMFAELTKEEVDSVINTVNLF